MNQIIPVTFHQDSLALIEHKGQPFVAMKPVVENMGLAWSPQRSKISEKFSSVVTNIVTTGGDGKQYEMLCLPMMKITSWLHSINPNKVKSELRDKIIQYQEECDEVLWQYWTKGHVGRQSMAPTITQQIAAGNARQRLIDKLKKETHPEIRRSIYQQVEHASQIMGIDTPDMESIGYTIKPSDPDPMLEAFWETVETIGLDKVNHSIPSDIIAINLIHFAQCAEKARIKIPPLTELRRVLKESKSPRFIEQKKIYSRIKKTTISCWTFEKEPEL